MSQTYFAYSNKIVIYVSGITYPAGLEDLDFVNLETCLLLNRLSMKSLQHVHPIFFLLVANILEVSGDAVIRTSIYNHNGWARLGLMLIGGFLVFGYGTVLNLTPVEFGQVVGLYIATLFVV